ncbi:recombinase zinc beta ribbon domain-containing protein, partial [Chloroflexota bacterium]
CCKCGRRYHGEPEHQRYRYYRCPARNSVVSPEPCRNARVNADWLEDAVWQQIKAVLQDPAIFLKELEKRRDSKTQSKHLEDELEVSRKRLDILKETATRAERLYIYTPNKSLEDTVAELGRLNAEREEVEANIAELEKHISEIKQLELGEAAILEFCNNASQRIEEFSFEYKRLALEALRIKIWVDGDKISIQGFIPMDNFDYVTQSS